MHSNLYLARQPILDRLENIIGYEFFYRDTYGECTIDDPRHATASVLANLLNQVGSESAFGNCYAFINTDGPLLLTDILRTLPKEKFVFEISASTKINARIHEAIRYYHSLGYRFALDNASFNPHYIEAFGPIFSYIEFAKFDVTQTDIEQFALAPHPFSRMRLIAQKVEFYEMVEEYEKIGFEYFQGFYFANTHLITQRRIDPQYSDLIALFSLLQKDVPMKEISDSFKEQTILSLQLIQFLRSVYPEYVEGALSIQEMLERLGKNALMQWLMLIIYSKSGTKAIDEQNPHAVFAQNRIKVMEALLRKAVGEPTEQQTQQIYLIGTLSLLEGLMNTPLESVLQSLHPSSEIEDALIARSGMMGRIYAAALHLEKGEVNGAAMLLKSYGITPESLNSLHS